MTSLILLITDFSPFLLEHYLLDLLPFLRARYGKSALLIIAGTLCFDEALFDSGDHNVPNVTTGAALVISGLLIFLYEVERIHI